MMFVSYKLPLAFDAAALKADLERIVPGEWVAHFNRGYYVGEWKGLALRSTTGQTKQIYTPPEETASAVNTPVLDRCAYFQKVLGTFECPIYTARLLSLGPGARILEHTDDFLGGEDGLLRVHVPVTTDERVEFVVGGHRLSMLEGEAWCIDFSLPHRVTNDSDRDRVHLVVDCRINDWLEGLLPSEGGRG